MSEGPSDDEESECACGRGESVSVNEGQTVILQHVCEAVALPVIFLLRALLLPLPFRHLSYGVL